MYLTYDEYLTMGGTMDAAMFNKYEYLAERELDARTMTVDSVRKLEVAFPTKERDVEAVKRCMVAVCDRLYVLDDAGDEDAFYQRPIASMSSGSESVSFAASAADKARSSVDDRAVYLTSAIKRYLAGVQDKNGVNLLYGGPYPCIVTL